jgi:manganese/zinc/iron transport system permease protein
MDQASLMDILLLQAGYNATVVCLGAAALGAGAGAIGVFTLLRRRALISDAISHATLPGVGIAFLLGAWLTGSGRHLPLLLAGAAFSAALGLLAVHWITRATRLREDAAIGTVLSTFFAAGVVLLTLIQTLPIPGRAGLEGFLLGSAASMLAGEALFIAGAASVVALGIFLFLKEFGLLCFDAEFAASVGYNTSRLDMAIVGLLLGVIVIGLTTVGLILIIALAIIPPVTARFWTDRLERMVPIAAAIGASGSYVGAAISATAPDLPTGSVIVLCLGAIFVLSMLVSPVRGLVAVWIAHLRIQRVVHKRQGLLALARGEPVFDLLTLRVLRARGLISGDGSLTDAGRAAAAAMVRDQALWSRYRDDYPDEASGLESWSLRPIGDVLPPDLVAELERKLAPKPVSKP